jgi:hypothetical protein
VLIKRQSKKYDRKQFRRWIGSVPNQTLVISTAGRLQLQFGNNNSWNCLDVFKSQLKRGCMELMGAIITQTSAHSGSPGAIHRC